MAKGKLGVERKERIADSIDRAISRSLIGGRCYGREERVLGSEEGRKDAGLTPQQSGAEQARCGRGMFNYLQSLRMTPLQKASLEWYLHIFAIFEQTK